MTFNTLVKRLEEGTMEVAAWSGKGSADSQWAQVRTWTRKNGWRKMTINVTKVPVPGEAGRLA
jgi:hypothetical protein